MVLCFQPSDRKCPCRHGFKVMEDREQDCVKSVYDLCVEGTTRTQNGKCFTDKQWETHCSEQVH